jgi:SAM-dependent methyltransferase
MSKKLSVDKNLYGWKPVNYVNGVPWPRLDSAASASVAVPLKENYMMRSMDYLDTEAAKIIFSAQADIIQKHGISGIVDVGCRIGRINDILQERGYLNYRYMGFDTSPQPIEYSQAAWSQFDNIEYRCASWNELDKIAVDFKVECVIWSGVLLYRPQDHQKLFHEITVDFYNAPFAIIQEPLQDQVHWKADLSLNTIADQLAQYKSKYSQYSERIVEAEVFSGRRVISEIKI